MDDSDSERICASHLRDQYVVQDRSAGGGRDIGERAAHGERGIAGDGAEPRTQLRDVAPCFVAGGVVGVGSQRDTAALAVEDLGYGGAIGVGDR